MATEKTGHNGQEEQRTATSCCSPRKFVKMLARCRKEMKGGCSATMQEMMQRGCCRPEEK